MSLRENKVSSTLEGLEEGKGEKRCNYIFISKIISMIKKRNNPPTYAAQSQPKV